MSKCIVLLSAVIFCAPGGAAEKGGRFVQDRFAVGYWVTPPADDKIDERFREIADAHFTLIIAGYTPQAMEKELAMCKKYDLKALFWVGNVPLEKLPGDPACWGYVVKDEPNVKDFPALRKRVDQIKTVHRDKLAYINLYPNYATPKQMGTPTYDEHVTKYMAMVRPEVLSMDHYPRFIPGSDTRSSYCENLAVLRKHSLQAGIPFWNFFNTMPFGSHTDPTEGQIRWQIYASLVYGAKGVLYFCYYTPRSEEFPRGGAIIDTRDRKTRHYDQARRINAELKNLGPTLMQLTSTKVCRIKGQESDNLSLKDTPLKAIINAQTKDAPLDLQLGVYRHRDGRSAVLVQNYHFAYTTWMTLQFAGPANKVVEVDKTTGREVPVYDESPDMEGLQISLDAGDGRLFVVNK